MQTNLFSYYGRVVALLITLILMAGCNDSGSSDNDAFKEADGSNASANNQAGSGSDIEAICALPTLGPAVVSAAGGDCEQSGGGDGFDASALCAVPVLGPLLVSGSGGAECDTSSANSSGFGGLPVQELEPLCDIPRLGAIILDMAGGRCPGEDASPFSTISAGFICAIPELGEPLATAIGENCNQTPTGPFNPGLLCLVPGIGPLLVEAGGYDCLVPTAVSNPQDLACQVAPLDPVLEQVCPLPDPEALCGIPVLGPALVEPLLGKCPDSGAPIFLPPLEL